MTRHFLILDSIQAIQLNANYTCPRYVPCGTPQLPSDDIFTHETTFIQQHELTFNETYQEASAVINRAGGSLGSSRTEIEPWRAKRGLFATWVSQSVSAARSEQRGAQTKRLTTQSDDNRVIYSQDVFIFIKFLLAWMKGVRTEDYKGHWGDVIGIFVSYKYKCIWFII